MLAALSILGRGGSPLTLADPGITIDGGGLWLTAPPRPEGPFAFAEFVTFGTKWGADSPYAGGGSGPGTPGGTVTYSFMPDGVTDPDELEFGPDTITAVSSLPGFQACFLDEIRDAFDAWSAVADIQFAEVSDDGTAFDETGAIGDIRIGAHPFDGASNALAHAFYPPPNGTTAAGDLHFDEAENWTCDDSGIDIGLVALHEIGHSIGLEHEIPPPDAIMNPVLNQSLTVLQADDIAGAQAIYGPAGGTDSDGDGVGDSIDNCPDVANAGQEDADGDGVGDACDNCPDTANPGQQNAVHPLTAAGDHCEDPEPDGVFDATDNCPDTANPGQQNAVHPLTPAGDHCENPDGDAYVDANDNCPDVPTPWLVPPGDADCDLFSDVSESFMGTLPGDPCAPPPDAWPFDFNDDQIADLSDVLQYNTPGLFGSVGPASPYEARYDLSGDVVIDLSDVLLYNTPGVFGATCAE